MGDIDTAQTYFAKADTSSDERGSALAASKIEMNKLVIFSYSLKNDADVLFSDLGIYNDSICKQLKMCVGVSGQWCHWGKESLQQQKNTYKRFWSTSQQIP